MQGKRIYLDFNASTPMAPEVVTAMKQVLAEPFGNPSSEHWAGRPAKQAVETARRQVADLLGCEPHEVVFTSGGSESNNHALKGVFFANGTAGAHIVTTQVEHPAVLNPCRFLERLGATVTYGCTVRREHLRKRRNGFERHSDLERNNLDPTLSASVSACTEIRYPGNGLRRSYPQHRFVWRHHRHANRSWRPLDLGWNHPDMDSTIPGCQSVRPARPDRLQQRNRDGRSLWRRQLASRKSYKGLAGSRAGLVSSRGGKAGCISSRQSVRLITVPMSAVAETELSA